MTLNRIKSSVNTTSFIPNCTANFHNGYPTFDTCTEHFFKWYPIWWMMDLTNKSWPVLLPLCVKDGTVTRVISSPFNSWVVSLRCRNKWTEKKPIHKSIVVVFLLLQNYIWYMWYLPIWEGGSLLGGKCFVWLNLPTEISKFAVLFNINFIICLLFKKNLPTQFYQIITCMKLCEHVK